MIVLVWLARLIMHLVHFTADQVILIGHDLKAVVSMGSHHTCAELLHEGVHITMDIVTVGSGGCEVGEGTCGLGDEGIDIPRGTHPVSQSIRHSLSWDLHADNTKKTVSILG
jgi:hypothetical protein